MKFAAEKVMMRLEDAGFAARIAGGAVRDFLAGVEPKDYDIATTARPAQVIMLYPDCIPTGLQHGTVTIMQDGFPIEVTTLRRDVETDGRHADVEFITDWKEDAGRRDFTMNAMFMDRHGEIYDFFNGQEDLKNGIVRFVGNAEDRIKEDYLRIMRYFRFLARLDFPAYDTKTLNIIKENRNGLAQISGERIWSELIKIFSAKNFAMISEIMDETISEPLSLFLPQNAISSKADPALIKIIDLYWGIDLKKLMKDRYRTSSEEIEYVELYEFLNTIDNFYSIVEKAEKKPSNLTMMMQIFETARRPEWKNWKEMLENGLPKWPFSGEDLLNEGFKGKELGDELKRRKQAWLANFEENFFERKQNSAP